MIDHPVPSRPLGEQPFPFEQLLAFYRGQIDDPATGKEIRQKLSEDVRWQAHWESIQYLDLERDSARSDGRRLKTFPEGPVSDFTESIAESDGDVLLALFGDPASDRIAGHTPAEWREHLSSCPYGRRMRRRAYAGLQRRRTGLPEGEKLLCDWLLEHYYAEDLERITQTVGLETSLRRADQVKELSSGSPGVLGLDEALVSGLQEALTRPRPERLGALHDAVYNYDPLYAVAAGEEEEENVVWTDPLWFTCLTAFPKTLSWDRGDQRGPWRVCLWNSQGVLVGERLADRTELVVPEPMAQGFGEEEDVRWEVLPAESPESRPLVCGVFRVLAAGQTRSVAEQLTRLAAGPAGIQRDLAAAQCHYAAGLFDAAVKHLRSLEGRYERGTAAMLVRRSLAAVFLAVSRELTGSRGLGHREGLWATNLAGQSLTAAYAALGIRYHED